MIENTDQYPAGNLDATGEFFSVGGPLHAVRPGYVPRPADELLYKTLVSGHHAHVIAPDRTGKSSLIACTSARLQNNGVKVAVLDLDQIAERDGGADAGRWYYSIVYRLLRQLRLKVDLQAWWQDKAILSYRQRLVEFFIEIVLQNIEESIVIFIDQVQCTAALQFPEQLLASVRAAHNARTTDPEFSRLTFALFGECDPHTLVDDPELSPFSVSREILLGDFNRPDLDVFATELNLSADDSRLALDCIYEWTGGQPYLTQKLARTIAREQISGDISAQVDRIAMQQLAGRAALHSEPHMSHIHRSITADGKYRDGMLNLYGKLRKGIGVQYDPQSRIHSQLLASGLIVRDGSDALRIKNRIYASVFTARWANENLPIHWRGPAIAAALVLAIAAIPFLYTQVLPRPFVDRMFDTSATLDSVASAHNRLRSFPGHADDADRLFKVVLRDRSTLAPDLDSIMRIDGFARQLDGNGALADSLIAMFWDRQVREALRGERRDDALIAALESLIETTTQRRRRAATLVGNDYPRLVGTVPERISTNVAFNPDDVSIAYFNGSQVSQWVLNNGILQAKAPWTITALDVTPLVRRVVVDRAGQVDRIGLSVNVSHGRLSDLLLKLIAPSGRTVDLQFRQSSSSANELIRIERNELASLVGEALSGTWSLSIRDEVTGIDGHLVGWNLSLNSQVIVESFDRGLDIPDPVEKASNKLWVTPNGRFAIARSLQSDGMRVWDLASGNAARTSAVAASENVIGLSTELGYLVTAAANSVNVWRTATGRRHAALSLGIARQPVRLSDDGRHLLVQGREGTNTTFELWSLETSKAQARIRVAGTPALVTIDASGSHIAIADYDRSVRVWDFKSARLLAQFNLDEQPSQIMLSPDGRRLGAVHGERGVSLWHADVPEKPLLQEWQSAHWQIAFSGTGQKFLAGSPRYGFQVYQSSDGSVMGPLLGSGMNENATSVLAFSTDEKFVLTASAAGISRLWIAPQVAAASAADAGADSAHALWQNAGNMISAISPGGARMAVGDSEGHVHIIRVGAGEAELADESDEISFIGHQAPVVALSFSRNGQLVASAGANNSIRVWDASSGLPKTYSAHGLVSNADQMRFSSDASRLAINSGRRVSIIDVETGVLLTEIALDEMHVSMAFLDEAHLYLGSEGGALRILAPDRSGSWNLRNVWQGTSSLRKVEISPTSHQLIMVNAQNEVRSLDIRSGRVSEIALTMPDTVSDVLFDSGNSRVLLRTPRWVHLAALSPSGLLWLDALRAPKALPGSRMVLDTSNGVSTELAATNTSAGDRSNKRVLVLTRETGFAEVAELQFNYPSGPALVGNRQDLLEEWRVKLAIPARNPAEPAAGMLDLPAE